MFDLVVTNPPFVVSPERRFLYRDGAPDEDDGGGEERCAAIVEKLPTVLAPGGIGIVLANRGRRKDEEWSALPL